jgi:hypothetical protein
MFWSTHARSSAWRRAGVHRVVVRGYADHRDRCGPIVSGPSNQISTAVLRFVAIHSHPLLGANPK